MILHQVEVKEWLNSRSSCAKVNSWSGLDPERTYRQKRHVDSAGMSSVAPVFERIILEITSKQLGRTDSKCL